MTLTNPEKRMLIYVLDLFDGEAEAHKAPPPPPPPLEFATELRPKQAIARIHIKI